MKYLQMRAELLDYLEGLSNIEYQRSCWIRGICPEGVQHDELDYAVHFFFDDTLLSAEPEKLIGFCLKDAVESSAVKDVCEKLSTVFQKYGKQLSDAEYIELPEWGSVIDSASRAHRIIAGSL